MQSLSRKLSSNLFENSPKKSDYYMRVLTMSGGERVTCAMVTTRARKRKVGERDSLWDLVVKNDDISLTHIVPRLNQTDVKFLYGCEQ